MANINSTILTAIGTTQLDLSYGLYLVNASGNMVLNLPAPTVYQGQVVTFTRTDTSMNFVVNFTSTSGLVGTLSGSAPPNYTLVPGSSVRFQSDGTNWNNANDNKQIVGSGNILVVDAYYGIDTGANAGTINGRPFKTIGAALSAATGTSALVFVNPGTYSSETLPLVVPTGVNIRGATTASVIILKTGAIAGTDMMNVNANCSVEDLTLTLSSTGNFLLRGVVFTAGTASSTSLVRRLAINITCTGTGTSNTIGIEQNLTNGTAPPPLYGYTAVRDCDITISSSAGTGTSQTVGVLCDGTTITNTLNCSRTTIAVLNTFGGVLAGGVTTYGAQTNTSNTQNLTFSNSSISAGYSVGTSGGTVADVFEFTSTPGSVLGLVATTLFHSTVVGGITSRVAPSMMTFFATTIKNASTEYFYPGTFNPLSATIINIPMPIQCVCYAMYVTFGTAGKTGGTTNQDVFNVMNGATTILTLSIPAGTTSGNTTIINAGAGTFLANSNLNLEVIDTNATGPLNATVTLAFY